jgi:uncharacterized protein YndB with AHSA1/START domain
VTKISVATTVGVDPQTAFAYVADLTKHPEWANPKSGLSVEHTSGEGVGARYTSKQRFLGKGAGADITVTVLEPGRKVAFEAVERGKKFGHTFTFSPEGGGTTITRDIDAPLPPVVSLIAKPAIRKEAQAGLEMLKARLESGA